MEVFCRRRIDSLGRAVSSHLAERPRSPQLDVHGALLRLFCPFRRPSTPLTLDRPPARDIPIMLVECFGKRVAAGPISDEIQVIRARRVCDRFKRSATRIADRPWWEPANLVGAIGVWRIKLRARYGARDAPGIATIEPIENGWVRLKPHAKPQTIGKDARDTRSFISAGLSGQSLP